VKRPAPSTVVVADDPAIVTVTDPAAIGRKAVVAAAPLTSPEIVAVPVETFAGDAGEPLVDVGAPGIGALLPQAAAMTVMAIAVTVFKHADRIAFPPAASCSLSYDGIPDSAEHRRGPRALRYKAGATTDGDRCA